MFRKIKLWWMNVRHKTPVTEVEAKTYSYKELLILLENAHKVGYNDGKRDGLAIAREQATKSLKEILWQQNKHQ